MATFTPNAKYVVAFSEFAALPHTFMSIKQYFLTHELSVQSLKMSNAPFEYSAGRPTVRHGLCWLNNLQ